MMKGNIVALIVATLVLVVYGEKNKRYYAQVDYAEVRADWEEAIIKAQALVSQLSLAEQVSLATGVGWQNGPCVGNTPSIDRVNYPGLCLEDSPTGVRFTTNASAFPAGINAAATWDKALMYERGVAMGEEYRGKGVNVALSPMMNLGRVAAGGRNWEGAGGDPYLAGEVAVQTLLGIQSQGVMTTAKHYIGNEQEHYRTQYSSNIDDRTVHELYSWPFMRCVASGVTSIMCSYNQVNNSYACQNNRTLNEILKGEFGFQGFVMSDWAATMSGVPSVLGGLDMTMPGDITFGSGTSYFGQALIDAVNNGSVPADRVADMATRIITPWYLLGQDQDYPPVNFDFRDPTVGTDVNVQADHYLNIREVGAASNILLVNDDDILPILSSFATTQQYTIALIGGDAQYPSGGPNSCADHGCIDGTLAQGWGSGTTNFPYLVDPASGISGRAAQNNQTVVAFYDDWDLDGATNAASSADIAIVFALSDSGEDYITVDGNQGDRNNLSLWNNGDDLIAAVAAVSDNVIVVLHVVGPVLMPWIDLPSIKAVIIAGLPGQESGNALADVLFGDVNPSGKLVYTIAKEESDYPASVVYNSNDDFPQIDYTEGLLIDYRWFDSQDIEPLFEFGFGLSYTTFNYSDIAIDTSDLVGAESTVRLSNSTTAVKVTVTVSNIGDVDGQEVSQLYIGFPAAAGEPPKVLRGFEKTSIDAGSSEQVTFYLSTIDIAIWDVEDQVWVIPDGTFTVYVGSSSRVILATGSFTYSSMN